MLGFVAAGLAVYFVVGPLVQRAVLRAQLSFEVPAALERSRTTLDADRAAAATRAQQELRLGAPVYRVTHTFCWTDHRDQGWFAVGYDHHCAWRELVFFEAPANTALDRALARHEEQGRGARYASLFEGDFREAARLDTPAERRTDRLYVTTPQATDAHEVVDRFLLVGGVVAYAAGEAWQARHVLDESGDRQLDPGKRYLITTSGGDYYKRDLGCAIGTAPFCGNPLGGV